MGAGDAIWLLLRRFALPVLVSALIAPYAAAFLPALWEGRGLELLSLEITPRSVAGFSLFTGAGILLVGLPAGLLLARARLGLAASLIILAVIGAIGGWLVLLLFVTVMGLWSESAGNVALFALMLGAPAGGATAVTWTFFNTDLFRRASGAAGRQFPDA